MAPPFARFIERLPGLIENKLLAVACELEVPDLLAAGPLELPELARRSGADGDALGRMMRFLVARGFFRRERDGRYANNTITELLRRDHPESVRDWVLFIGADWHWNIWNHAADAIRSGTSAVEAATGSGFFEYVNRENPSAGEQFNAAMAAGSRLQAQLLTRAYDFTQVRRVCDVGGGSGNALLDVLESNPAADGVVLDLPELEDEAVRNIADRGLSARCRFVPGDFFAEVPPGFDLYQLLAVIHDWGDDACVQILSNIRRAAPDATILVVEGVVAGHDHWDVPKAMDLLMLALSDQGRERTAQEFRTLFGRAGLVIERDITLPNLFHVFELVADRSN